MFMGPMYIQPPPIVYLVTAAAALGMVVGLFWIHRIGGQGDDEGRPIFRYRAEGRPRPRPPERRRFARPSLPDAIRRRTTIRWLATRLELAIAVACAAISVALWMVGPHTTSALFLGPDWGTPLAIVGIAGYLVGLAWMIRIAREPAETGHTVWRSRDG